MTPEKFKTLLGANPFGTRASIPVVISKAVPASWTDLKPLLNTETWVECEAWAVGGGDPDGVTIKVKGGRATYESAWCVFGKRGSERVRLARLDSMPDGIREVVRFVDPETRVLVRRDP